MHIFITGATGYIGNHLAKRLANEGHIVHALCRDITGKSLLQHPNIKLFKGDILDSISIEKAMQGCEHVYHLAAFAKPWAKKTSIYFKVNVEGTENVLEVAKKLLVKKIVHTSTAGTLGPSRAKPVKEDDLRWTQYFNDYEQSKMQAEKLCLRYVHNYNLKIVIVNPPRVYGPGIETESNAVSKLIKKYQEGSWKIMPCNGEQLGSYVYVDDVVDGHVLAMQYGNSGERYILSGENASFKRFFHLLEKITGKKNRLYNVPMWMMLMAGYCMKLKTFFTGKPPLITPEFIRKYAYNWALDCTKAKQELGYSYMPLEEGLQRTVHCAQLPVHSTS